MIKPEEVYRLSLRELVERSEEGRKELNFLENNVLFHLFSNYPRRRRRALKNIRSYLGENTLVEKIERDGAIWAYLRPAENKGQYIFVGRYAMGKPFFEFALQENEL